ncbi:hypothetical protein P4U05_10295 [Bacillus paranthracis]|uniref:hypothetical protein n=1 Tax=Bacillus paranthracis TaxID=2026186 RepID=UPI0012B8EEF1|nr:hypothetical protein [Bacillus paranthracis]MDA1586653.1 hypothetical protein [Bacillus cereus group sp. TH230-1LC]MRC73275.1 hypothetical protein [Bacillus thuringiensis]MCR6796191.1 hypothetical protein [Bacillus paranthracis]MEC3359481.1 hypothetical protein [Bacillus paranthracis]MED0783062.1 hypothetical protein [Bacillus paranthracis]
MMRISISFNNRLEKKIIVEGNAVVSFLMKNQQIKFNDLGNVIMQVSRGNRI